MQNSNNNNNKKTPCNLFRLKFIWPCVNFWMSDVSILIVKLHTDTLWSAPTLSLSLSGVEWGTQGSSMSEPLELEDDKLIWSTWVFPREPSLVALDLHIKIFALMKIRLDNWPTEALWRHFRQSNPKFEQCRHISATSRETRKLSFDWHWAIKLAFMLLGSGGQTKDILSIYARNDQIVKQSPSGGLKKKKKKISSTHACCSSTLIHPSIHSSVGFILTRVAGVLESMPAVFGQEAR